MTTCTCRSRGSPTWRHPSSRDRRMRCVAVCAGAPSRKTLAHAQTALPSWPRWWTCRETSRAWSAPTWPHPRDAAMAIGFDEELGPGARGFADDVLFNLRLKTAGLPPGGLHRSPGGASPFVGPTQPRGDEEPRRAQRVQPSLRLASLAAERPPTPRLETTSGRVNLAWMGFRSSPHRKGHQRTRVRPVVCPELLWTPGRRAVAASELRAADFTSNHV